MAPRWLPPDPRPSKAIAEHRKLRKEIEKEHPFGWIPPILLGLLGVNVALNIADDVKKIEMKKDREEKQEEERKKQREAQKRRERGERSSSRSSSDDDVRSRRSGQTQRADRSQRRRDSAVASYGSGRDRPRRPESMVVASKVDPRDDRRRYHDDRRDPHGGTRFDDRRPRESYDYRRVERVREDGRVRTHITHDTTPPPQRPRPRRYSSDF